MRCDHCGQEHPIDSLELSFRRPDIVALLDEAERQQRVQENNDLCVLDGKQFFVRAVMPMPVKDRQVSYNIGIWVRVARNDFERIYELWDAAQQADEPPIPGELANNITDEVNALGLKADLKLTGPTTRPEAYLKSAEHRLYREQTNGITSHQAHEYSILFA